MTDAEYMLSTLALNFAHVAIAATIATRDLSPEVAIDLVLETMPTTHFARKRATIFVANIHRGLITGQIGTPAYRSRELAAW